MDIKEEIEEIDNIVYQNACNVIKICGTCEHGKKEGTVKECISPKIAKALISAGYRKADEVRKETAKEILKPLYDEAKEYGLAEIDFYNMELRMKEYGVETE